MFDLVFMIDGFSFKGRVYGSFSWWVYAGLTGDAYQVMELVSEGLH